MPSLGGLPEVPCAKCERRVPGLRWGELCPECRWARDARARRLASRAALAAAALMALYVSLRMPAQPMARVYAAIAVLVTYILVRRIVSTVAKEMTK